MNLVDLLKLYGFDPAVKTRLVRHTDSKCDLELVHRMGYLDEYQARQGSERFRRCDQIVSFMGERGSRSRFLGVYRVDGVSTGVPPWTEGYPFPGMNLGNFFYKLSKAPQYAELEERLVIDWGPSTRVWVQHVKPHQPKLVIEILPRGHVIDFPGYDEVRLTFDELKRIVDHRDANRTWYRTLSAVAGVYLIADGIDGRLYVGSAYGQGGIFSRWATYAKTRHGGNKRLRELLDEDPARYQRFTFSILRTLPKSMTHKEVIQVESRYKLRLGARAFGLNEN